MKSYEELAADWLTSTGAVSEAGPWRLQQSLADLIGGEVQPLVDALRAAVACGGLCDRCHRTAVEAMALPKGGHE